MSFSGIYLDPAKGYRFLFWADNTAAAPSDLTNVPYQTGSIAFAAKVDWDNNNDISAELKHIVSKVTLKTTTNVDAGKKIYITLPATYAAYNVNDGTVLNDPAEIHLKSLLPPSPAIAGARKFSPSMP